MDEFSDSPRFTMNVFPKGRIKRDSASYERHELQPYSFTEKISITEVRGVGTESYIPPELVVSVLFCFQC